MQSRALGQNHHEKKWHMLRYTSETAEGLQSTRTIIIFIASQSKPHHHAASGFLWLCRAAKEVFFFKLAAKEVGPQVYSVAGSRDCRGLNQTYGFFIIPRACSPQSTALKF
jgi:hypothetical protein